MSDATNSLAQASSAYLRSAMHQPIEWHEWGEEAFAKAQRENKPILLDIGAVWCHWCHVMDRESYESAEMAEIINRQFIAVKVDRDERPDVDSRYQLAVSAIAGHRRVAADRLSHAGWVVRSTAAPTSRLMISYGRPSFKKILLAIADAYRERRDEVLQVGRRNHAHAGRRRRFRGAARRIFHRASSASWCSRRCPSSTRRYGGFGSAPKFPHPAALDLLMDWYVRDRRGARRDRRHDDAYAGWRRAESTTSLRAAFIATR